MRRNKYLYQLIITSSLLIILPTLFFFSVFLQKSYDEINRTNNEYYENISQLFCDTVVNEVSKLNEYVAAFTANSKAGEKSAGIFYEGTKKMSENDYYYWEASRDLVEYGKKIGYETFGVYYYDTEYVLYGGNKFSAERFIEIKLEGVLDPRTTNFFSEDIYSRSKTVFAPVFCGDGTYQALLVGTCTKLGKNNEKALCFCLMQPKDMEFFYQSVQGRPWESYYLLNSNSGEFLLGLGSLDEERIAQGYDIDALSAYEIRSGEIKNEQQDLFVAHSKRHDLTFVVDVSGNVEQNNVLQFYNNMKILIIYILLIMIVMCCLAIYFNYRPIYRLLEKIKGDGKDEFEIILNTWEEQSLRLTEQRMMIMDLLMNRLIYGLPISEEHMGKLGVSDTIKKYNVFLIDNYVLDSGEVELVMDGIENEFKTLLFITDLQGEKSTVIIAFMENNIVERVSEWLKTWCTENVKYDYSLHEGCVVDKLDDISRSLASCKEQRSQTNITESESKQDREKIRTENYERLREDILEYLESNFCNRDLTQTMVADNFKISVYSLSRMFKKQFGMGFSEYVNGKRLEKAKELLETTSLSVRDVAITVGFSEANYFSRLFKQNLGMSPTEFRNMQNK